MAAVMIGAGPHKASHTAIAISATEEPVGELRVRACAAQAERLLAAGNVNKNDPNDARSVAIAALRPVGVRQAGADDHAAVLKIWSKRHRDLSRTRTRSRAGCTPCCGLVPGGVSRHITAGQAMQVLGSITPSDTVAAARCELAAVFADDLRRTGAQLRDTRNKLTTAVRAAGTSLTGLYGGWPGDRRRDWRRP